MIHSNYFQLENCAQPAIITKDLCMVVCGRDSRTYPRSLKHLFSGSYKNAEANRISGVYETTLKRAAEAGSPGSSQSAPFSKSISHKTNWKLIKKSSSKMLRFFIHGF